MGKRSSDTDDKIQDFPNDALDQIEGDPPMPKKPKKKVGRPWKGEQKEQPKQQSQSIYNTRSRLSVSEVAATATATSSMDFQVDCPILDASATRKYKSWADQCENKTLSPNHNGGCGLP